MGDRITERATALGADVRCVTYMMPGSAPHDGVTGTIEILVEDHVTSLHLMRHEFRSEPMRPRRARIGLGLGPDKRLDAFLSTIARLQARERAVADHGGPHSPYPAWAFSVDAMALEMAAIVGVDLTACALPGKWMRTTRVVHGRIATPEEAWIWSREAQRISGAEPNWARPGSGTSAVAELNGDRLVMRVLSLAGVPGTLREDPTGVRLITREELPETVMQGLKGRKVSEVFDGYGATHTITSVVRKDDYTWFSVKGPRVPLVAAPEGVDTSWMEL